MTDTYTQLVSFPYIIAVYQVNFFFVKFIHKLKTNVPKS